MMKINPWIVALGTLCAVLVLYIASTQGPAAAAGSEGAVRRRYPIAGEEPEADLQALSHTGGVSAPAAPLHPQQQQQHVQQQQYVQQQQQNSLYTAAAAPAPAQVHQQQPVQQQTHTQQVQQQQQPPQHVAPARPKHPWPSKPLPNHLSTYQLQEMFDFDSFDDCMEKTATVPYDQHDGNTWRVNERYWNAEERWRPMEMRSKALFYVGGNVGGDLQIYLSHHPEFTYYVFEPLREFYIGLQEKFRSHSNVKILPYGIADRDKRACFRVEGGASAQISDTNGGSKTECVDLRSTASVIEELGLTHSDFHVHMNCEGCEYDVLEHLIQSGIINKVETLQFGSHNLESTGVWGKVPERYCKIQMALLQTHDKPWGIPWSWDRFVRKHA